MADEQVGNDESSEKGDASLAANYARRARKFLANEGGADDRVQELVSLASVHAMLDLAEAIRSTKSN